MPKNIEAQAKSLLMINSNLVLNLLSTMWLKKMNLKIINGSDFKRYRLYNMSQNYLYFLIKLVIMIFNKERLVIVISYQH